MAGVTRYIPPTDDSPELAELERVYKDELLARRKAHAEAWRYYRGEHRKHLKNDGSGTDDNITINLVELLIDKGVSSLVGTNEQGMVEGVLFDIVDRPGEPGFRGNGILDNPAQDMLDQIWTVNRRDILLHKAVMNAAVCGHAFLKVIPDGARDMETGEKVLPRLVNLNPDIISVFWDESDYERVLWYRIEYGSEYARKRQDIVREIDEQGEDLPQWTIYDYQEDGNQWKLLNKSTWEYEWPPIIDWPNLPNPNGYYGLNDIRTGGVVNDALNFLISNMQRIIKHHAHPKTVIIGANADEVQQTAVDRLWVISNENAKVLNLEMQADLGSSMEMVRMLRRFFFDSGREVDPSSVHDRLGDLTNFALRVLYTDTLAKGGTKRLLAGDALKELCRRLLEMQGYGFAHPITVIWPRPLPTDPLTEAQALAIDRQHGLSRETYLERRRYVPEQELQRRSNERAEEIEEAVIVQQSSITDALEAIGRRVAKNGVE